MIRKETARKILGAITAKDKDKLIDLIGRGAIDEKYREPIIRLSNIDLVLESIQEDLKDKMVLMKQELLLSTDEIDFEPMFESDAYFDGDILKDDIIKDNLTVTSNEGENVSLLYIDSISKVDTAVENAMANLDRVSKLNEIDDSMDIFKSKDIPEYPSIDVDTTLSIEPKISVSTERMIESNKRLDDYYTQTHGLLTVLYDKLFQLSNEKDEAINFFITKLTGDLENVLSASDLSNTIIRKQNDLVKSSF